MIVSYFSSPRKLISGLGSNAESKAYTVLTGIRGERCWPTVCMQPRKGNAGVYGSIEVGAKCL